MLCRNVSIFYLQNLSSIFQVQEKLKACRSLKLIFSSSCFNVNDSHVKIVWLHEEYAEFNWWCSLFLFLIGNTLFEYIWSQNLKLFVLSCTHTNSNIKNLVVIFIFFCIWPFFVNFVLNNYLASSCFLINFAAVYSQRFAASIFSCLTD